MAHVLKFMISFALVAITALLSSYFSYLGVNTFYEGLTMPPLTPPNEVFRFVWPALYVLMIISFYFVLEKENNSKAVKLFVYQLVLHVLWCFLFFSKGLFLFGFADIVLLLLTVAFMLKAFYALSPAAAFLQYPYFIWLLFATYLNAGVWYLNGTSL